MIPCTATSCKGTDLDEDLLEAYLLEIEKSISLIDLEGLRVISVSPSVVWIM